MDGVGRRDTGQERIHNLVKEFFCAALKYEIEHCSLWQVDSRITSCFIIVARKAKSSRNSGTSDFDF